MRMLMILIMKVKLKYLQTIMISH